MNKIFFLISSLAVLYAFEVGAGRLNPVCDIIYSGEDGEEEKVRETSTLRSSPSRDERVLGQDGQVIKIPGYPTFLICSSFHPHAALTEIDYEILKTRDKADEGATIVGKIQLQFYPQAHEMRLRYIEVDEKHQRQHHAMRGLESLFADLKRRHEFKAPRKIYLEVNAQDKGAQALYAKFGFSVEGFVAADLMKMSVQSDKIKFPLFNKSARDDVGAASGSQ